MNPFSSERKVVFCLEGEACFPGVLVVEVEKVFDFGQNRIPELSALNQPAKTPSPGGKKIKKIHLST